MNLLAIDIGNTNITFALYVESAEVLTESVSGSDEKIVSEKLKYAWEHIPFSKSAKEDVRDGVILVSSVKSEWTDMIRKIAKELLDEKVIVFGEDMEVPIEVAFEDRKSVGTDRLLAALAGYEVVKDMVIVADFGTACTVDIVDEKGVFQGGTITPGFGLAAVSLGGGTAQLPIVKVKRPDKPFGQNTNDAINAGLYYSAISSLQEIIRRYSEYFGRWPQTIVSGAGGEIIKEDCDFIDSFVTDIVCKGMVVAYNKHLEEQV